MLKKNAAIVSPLAIGQKSSDLYLELGNTLLGLIEMQKKDPKITHSLLLSFKRFGIISELNLIN